MRKILSLVLITGMLSCGDDEAFFRTGCLPANLQNGLIAFYPFNNGSLNDESSHSNHVTNPTTAVTASDRMGNSNCAYQFDNSPTQDEYLSTANTNFLNGLQAFSISLWYQPIDTSRSTGDLEILLSRGMGQHCPDRRGEWSLGLYDCRRAVFGHNNSVWANPVTAPAYDCLEEIAVLTDNWHHVVATKNGDDYKIYFNGNLDDVVSGIGNCSNLHPAGDIGDMFIGKDFTGKIDDILIYNRALSQAEVMDLYGLEACCQ